MSHCRLVGQTLQFVALTVCALIRQWKALPSTAHATWDLPENVVIKLSQHVVPIKLLAYIKGIQHKICKNNCVYTHL